MGSLLALSGVSGRLVFLYVAVFGLGNTQGHVCVRIEYLETLNEKQHEIDRYRWSM